MAFLSAETNAAFLENIHLQGLADRINHELSGSPLQASTEEIRLLRAVTIPLSGGTKAVVGVDHRPPGCWLVAVGNQTPVRLPLESEVADLARYVAASATAAVTGMPLPSPYRWRQLTSDPLTELMDQLVEAGVPQHALSRPGSFVDEHDRRYRRRPGPAHFELTYESQTTTLWVSNHEGLGWTVDAQEHQSLVAEYSGRLDLRRALGPSAGPAPVQLSADDLHTFGALLAAQAEWISDSRFPYLSRYSQNPVDDPADDRPQSAFYLALSWLRSFGLLKSTPKARHDKLWTDGTTLVADSGDTTFDLPRMQRLFGIAALEGLSLCILVRNHCTKPALDWAEAAKVPVFSYTKTAPLRPQTQWSRTLTPLVPLSLRPPTCEATCDSTFCKVAGCGTAPSLVDT